MGVEKLIEESFEKYIELKGLSPDLIGRLQVTPKATLKATPKKKSLYDVEIDIILSESGKIYKHVAILYDIEGAQEALSLGIFRLKKFLLASSPF